MSHSPLRWSGLVQDDSPSSLRRPRPGAVSGAFSSSSAGGGGPRSPSSPLSVGGGFPASSDDAPAVERRLAALRGGGSPSLSDAAVQQLFERERAEWHASLDAVRHELVLQQTMLVESLESRVGEAEEQLEAIREAALLDRVADVEAQLAVHEQLVTDRARSPSAAASSAAAPHWRDELDFADGGGALAAPRSPGSPQSPTPAAAVAELRGAVHRLERDLALIREGREPGGDDEEEAEEAEYSESVGKEDGDAITSLEKPAHVDAAALEEARGSLREVLHDFSDEVTRRLADAERRLEENIAGRVQRRLAEEFETFEARVQATQEERHGALQSALASNFEDRLAALEAQTEHRAREGLGEALEAARELCSATRAATAASLEPLELEVRRQGASLGALQDAVHGEVASLGSSLNARLDAQLGHLLDQTKAMHRSALDELDALREAQRDSPASAAAGVAGSAGASAAAAAAAAEAAASAAAEAAAAAAASAEEVRSRLKRAEARIEEVAASGEAQRNNPAVVAADGETASAAAAAAEAAAGAAAASAEEVRSRLKRAEARIEEVAASGEACATREAGLASHAEQLGGAVEGLRTELHDLAQQLAAHQAAAASPVSGSSSSRVRRPSRSDTELPEILDRRRRMSEGLAPRAAPPPALAGAGASERGLLAVLGAGEGGGGRGGEGGGGGGGGREKEVVMGGAAPAAAAAGRSRPTVTQRSSSSSALTPSSSEASEIADLSMPAAIAIPNDSPQHAGSGGDPMQGLPDVKMRRSPGGRVSVITDEDGCVWLSVPTLGIPSEGHLTPADDISSSRGEDGEPNRNKMLVKLIRKALTGVTIQLELPPTEVLKGLSNQQLKVMLVRGALGMSVAVPPAERERPMPSEGAEEGDDHSEGGMPWGRNLTQEEAEGLELNRELQRKRVKLVQAALGKRQNEVSPSGDKSVAPTIDDYGGVDPTVNQLYVSVVQQALLGRTVPMSYNQVRRLSMQQFGSLGSRLGSRRPSVDPQASASSFSTSPPGSRRNSVTADADDAFGPRVSFTDVLRRRRLRKSVSKAEQADPSNVEDEGEAPMDSGRAAHMQRQASGGASAEGPSAAAGSAGSLGAGGAGGAGPARVQLVRQALLQRPPSGPLVASSGGGGGGGGPKAKARA